MFHRHGSAVTAMVPFLVIQWCPFMCPLCVYPHTKDCWITALESATVIKLSPIDLLTLLLFFLLWKMYGWNTNRRWSMVVMRYWNNKRNFQSTYRKETMVRKSTISFKIQRLFFDGLFLLSAFYVTTSHYKPHVDDRANWLAMADDAAKRVI